MEEDGILLKEKKVTLLRMLRDKQNEDNVCMELIMWGDGHESRSVEQEGERRFHILSVIRVPSEWHTVDVCSNANHLYASFDDCSRIPGESHPRPEDARRAVFHFSLSEPDKDLYYAVPKCFFLASDEVASLFSTRGNLVFVGMKSGLIEIWDDSPCLLRTLLHAQDSFPQTQESSPNAISCFHVMRGKPLQYGFATIQQCRLQSIHDGTIISLWHSPDCQGQEFDPATIDVQVMTKIKYKSYPEIVWAGQSMLVLGYDRFGCLYLSHAHY